MSAAATSSPSAPCVDACLCPLCGQPNQCGMEAARQAPAAAASTPCWCTTVTFAPALLQQVPEAARRRACICRQCVTQSLPESPRP